MARYEFINNDEALSTAKDEEKSVYEEFTDGLVYTDKMLKKLKKERKKTISKQKKKIRKQASFCKELGKEVDTLKGELKKIKQGVAEIKKSARDSLFKELACCDDVAERKRLIEEIRQMEASE